MDSVRIYVVLICAFFSAVTSAVTPSLHTVPITKRAGAGLRRRQNSGAIGIGDIHDALYSIEVTIGSVTVPVLLDSGSSDLWAISTDCRFCESAVGTLQITASSFHDTGMGVELQYGDSQHTTFASGTIVSAPVSVAGIHLQDQFLAAINDTNQPVVMKQLSGIFGMGFPLGSEIFLDLFENTFLNNDNIDITDTFISSLPKQGPIISRLVNSGQLKQPMYTITLERETFQVGGNVGQLTLGQLPDGVSNNSLTWLPVRLYSEAQGGPPGPSSAPNEIYPLSWEIVIDDVILNGQTLPNTASPRVAGYSALIDTGTSVLAGPEIVVDAIYFGIPGLDTFDLTFPCDEPVDLVFIIGGKRFPVDPRDFIGQSGGDGIGSDCRADSILPTDPPSSGSLFSWIFGTPFLKSNLVAFYFGNLTHPSVDPPRIGLLSTVPENADDLYRAALSGARAGKALVQTSIAAPTTTFGAAGTDFAGVKQVSTENAVAPNVTPTSTVCGTGVGDISTFLGCPAPSPTHTSNGISGVRQQTMLTTLFVSAIVMSVCI